MQLTTIATKKYEPMRGPNTYIFTRNDVVYSLILFIYKWIRWIEMNGLSHSTWINEQLRNKNLDSFQLHLRTHHSVKLKIYQCSFVHRFIFCFWPLFFSLCVPHIWPIWNSIQFLYELAYINSLFLLLYNGFMRCDDGIQFHAAPTSTTNFKYVGVNQTFSYYRNGSRRLHLIAVGDDRLHTFYGYTFILSNISSFSFSLDESCFVLRVFFFIYTVELKDNVHYKLRFLSISLSYHCANSDENRTWYICAYMNAVCQ